MDPRRFVTLAPHHINIIADHLVQFRFFAPIHLRLKKKNRFELAFCSSLVFFSNIIFLRSSYISEGAMPFVGLTSLKKRSLAIIWLVLRAKRDRDISNEPTTVSFLSILWTSFSALFRDQRSIEVNNRFGYTKMFAFFLPVYIEKW